MTRVFLSYAEEDREAGATIAEWLVGRGVEVTWWQDASERGRRFIGNIEHNIASADLFIALLSPAYLVSPWCQHERNMALRRDNESDVDEGFLVVLEVAPTEGEALGFLGNFDRLDGRPPLSSRKLDQIAAALRLDARAGTSPQRPDSMPVFRNRDDELNKIVNALTTTGGLDLWVIISPPRMGKSWLLHRVERQLIASDASWSVRTLDLRLHALEVRTNARMLVSTLLDVDISSAGDEGPLTTKELRAIAATVISRQRPQAYVLDSAELLDSGCASEARVALTEVYNLVKHGGRRKTSRFALLIGSRRHDDWRGYGRGPRMGQRFEPLTLTEFGEHVVHQALMELDADLGRQPGSQEQWDCAQRLHRLSAGMPALLVRSMTWARDNEFLYEDESNSDDTFDEVARPYIRDELLAVDSLLPSGSVRQRDEMNALRHALRVLSVYRFITLSHLRFHLGIDPSFRKAMIGAGMSETDLWGALSRTSLCSRPVQELWLEFEPSIRRLMYRYYLRTAEERIEAHTIARGFYEGWTAARNAGREQPAVLVECLWHETSRMVLGEPASVPHRLPSVTSTLTREFAHSPVYEAPECSTFAAGRMRDDDEFQLLLESYPGLFEDVVKAVLLGIGGAE